MKSIKNSYIWMIHGGYEFHLWWLKWILVRYLYINYKLTSLVAAVNRALEVALQV